VHLHKRVFSTPFKKKAPRAVKALKEFAQKTMGTKYVRVEGDLNRFVWHKGVRNVPYRVRVRMERKRQAEKKKQDKFGEMYTIVSLVDTESFKDLKTKVIPVAEAEA
jgi:large subunit ribosomal protein L31e